MTDQEVLKAAAEHIRVYGFVKKMYFQWKPDAPPACCGFGAVRVAAKGVSKDPETGYWYNNDGSAAQWVQIDRVSRALSKGLGVRGFAVATTPFPAWNDEPERTAEQVIEHLEWCADHYDEIPPDVS